MNKAASADGFKQHGAFQSLRKTLNQERFAERIDRPLAYWVLPSDRRLPLAFLGRTLRDLLATDFAELTATPGVGTKKIGTLLKLLQRASTMQPASMETAEPPAQAKEPAVRQLSNAGFEPTLVSEAVWDQWRLTVRRHGLGDHKLGRLAPTLQALPTVVWHTPLSDYLDHSLAEIRQLRTHGEKRVRTILEVFHAVHQVLASSALESHLSVRLVPKFTLPLARWIADTAASAKVPRPTEVGRSLVEPLLAQIKCDCGETVAGLAEGRLGVRGNPQSVRQQARKLGVTRARVYQMLEQCPQVMAVRWPEGGELLGRLIVQLSRLAGPNDDLNLLRATAELFFSSIAAADDVAGADDDQPEGDAAEIGEDGRSSQAR